MPGLMPGLMPALMLGLALVGSCAAPPRVAGDAEGDRRAGREAAPPSPDPEAPPAPGPSVTDVLVRLAEAADAVTAGDPAQALELLVDLPDDDHGGVVPFLRGVAQLRLGNLPAARAELTRALEHDPDDVPTLSVLARVHYESGDTDRAVALLERAVALDPADAPSLASLGLLLMESGRLVEAFDHLQRAVESDPEQVEAHRGLALLFSAVDDRERAEQAWRRALDLSPDDTALHTGLGHLLRDGDRPREAAECYRRAAQLQPQSATHAANLGAAWLEAGEPQRARRQFERALLLEGLEVEDAVHLHFNLGRALERLGDTEGAADEYESALDLGGDADLARVYEALGLIRLDAGRRGEARRHLERALVSGGLGPSSLAELALLYDAAGATEDTLQCLELMRAAQQRDPEVTFRLAQVLVRASDPAVHDPGGAIELLRELVGGDAAGREGRGDHGAAWNLLAEALAVERRYDEALAAMDRALASAAPDDPRRPGYTAARERYASAAGDR